MSSPAASSRRVNLAGSDRTRPAWHPARKRLIGAVVLVMLGSFLPWVYLVGIPVSGAGGPGLWTFYTGTLGLAAVLMPWPRVAAGHAAVMSAVCLVLPSWQIGHVLQYGFGGWMPGPGLVMVFFGGVVALQCAWRLFRGSDSE
ncbi:hypothetical protein KUV85_12505 [Nocardioides panacisoli]|uniref:hypothetical protein n=1 Tax=Nocardioides panacisoli TaxID=627624 RepID=UPI001C6314E8|nr:hypothetical protein [Nocardioides panacisoli]QYJ03153.1 hypothetical protein KUV85_12505 [Nocardioides panacisoli]